MTQGEGAATVGAPFVTHVEGEVAANGEAIALRVTATSTLRWTSACEPTTSNTW